MSLYQYRLSPAQATALRRLQRHNLPIAEAQAIKQTTLEALYVRNMIHVRAGEVRITAEGTRTLDMQIHADIERKNTGAPFARAIAELANWTGSKEKIRIVRRKVA